MTIVPRQTDLIDELINVASRVGQGEKGCGDGGSTATPPDMTPPDPSKQTVTRDVIVNLEGAKRQSGTLPFPGGTFPKVTTDSHIIGEGVDPDTYKADRVRFDGKHRYWRRSDASRGNGTAPGSRICALPPGWWPTADVEADVDSGVRGQNATIRVEHASGIVRYVSGPDYPRAVDLSQIPPFAGGGGVCPGNDPGDPTGAGDGRQWDCCDGVVDELDPIVPPGGDTGGGGGTGSWTPIAEFIGCAAYTDGIAAPAACNIGGVLVLRGALLAAGGYNAVNGTFRLPDGMRPENPGSIGYVNPGSGVCTVSIDRASSTAFSGVVHISERGVADQASLAGKLIYLDGIVIPLS